MRPAEPLEPEVVAELEAIDATLHGEPVDPQYAELAELSLILRDERPALDPAFARRLDELAARRGVAVAAPRRRTRPSRGWLVTGSSAAAAIAAAVVLAIVLPHAGGGSSAASSSAAAASAAGGHAAAS